MTEQQQPEENLAEEHGDGETPKPDPEQQPTQLPDDHPLVRTLAEQKKTIRDLRTKAQKLDELEEAQKSEQQRMQDRLDAAEKKAADLEVQNLKAEIAAEKGLTLKQANRLVGSTRDELEDDADELLSVIGEAGKPRPPKSDPNQGRQPTGTATPADEFAAWSENTIHSL